MKLNNEQELTVRQFVSKNLKYRETKDEMLDHIFTALQHAPEGITFDDALNGVIKNIGGVKGLAKIEFAAKMASLKSLMVAYKKYAVQIITSPIIILIAAVTALVFYYSHRQAFLNIWPLFGAFFGGLPLNMIKRTVWRERNPANIKNAAFKIIPNAFILGMLLIVFLIVLPGGGKFDYLGKLMPYVSAGIVFITMMHGAILYKLSREEFQPNNPITDLQSN